MDNFNSKRGTRIY